MEHFRRLDVVQARHALEAGAVLLDVREEHEWSAGHAPQAVHIPLRQLPLRARELPEHRSVLVICRSGNRSAQAARALTDALGIRGVEVSNVEGGMVAWLAAGLPVVARDGAPGAVA